MIEILLPVYNGKQYLSEQIESIINQTNQDWVLKIRDDGSTDNSRETINKYCQKYYGKIIEIDSPKYNVGLSQSLNYLIESAPHGDYIMFSDQDDVWLPDKIQLSLDRMIKMESAYQDIPIAIFTDLRVVDEDLKTISNSFFQYKKIYPEVCYDFMKSQALNVAAGCTIIINKIAKRFILPFNKESIHDHWIINNISYYGKCDFINTPTILYRQHQKNIIGASKTNFLYLLLRIKTLSKLRAFNQMHKSYNFKINPFRFWFYKFIIYFKRFF